LLHRIDVLLHRMIDTKATSGKKLIMQKNRCILDSIKNKVYRIF